MKPVIEKHTIVVVINAPRYAGVCVDIFLIAVLWRTSIQRPMAVTNMKTSSWRHESTAKDTYSTLIETEMGLRLMDTNFIDAIDVLWSADI